ncbi:WG repeat-containing protein [Lishizhenia sp.]|uniref:WG repeat-containing protein n=1 Tax=Lishizhenia sp. TaxID=2497594 RepID=UPI00299E2B12|nr:WG repeat-containing protein [Lishizhenia sp.]MDX1445844.1 WG repeat-containing protein [Lishizhenia sp.]
MRLIFLSILLLSGLAFGQFPILKNGRWGVINAKGEIVVAPQYRGLSVFKYGMAVAKGEGDLCALVNLKNQELLPPIYDKIEILGKDVVRLFKQGEESLYQLSNQQILFAGIEQSSVIGENWFVFRSKNQTLLFNTQTLLYKELSVVPTVKKVLPNFIVFAFGDKGYNLYFDAYLNRFLQKEMDYNTSEVFDLEILRFEDSVTYVKHTNDSIWQLVDDISFHKSNYVLVKDGKMNITDGVRTISELEGDGFFPMRGGFILIRNKAFYGVVDSLYRPVLTTRYEGVTYLEEHELFQTFLQGRVRLYTKYGKDLLGKSFEEFKINLPLIKAYSGKGMTQYYVQDNKIIGSKTFENVVRVYGYGSNQREMDISFKPQLEIPPLWFSDTVFKPLDSSLITATDSVYIHSVKWGVKQQDSILVAPQFAQPRAYDSLPFSYSKNKRVSIIINHEDYKGFVFNANTTRIYRDKKEQFLRINTPENYSIIKSDNGQDYFSILQSDAPYRLGVKMTDPEGVLLNAFNGDSRFWRYYTCGYGFTDRLSDLIKDVAFMERRNHVEVKKNFNFYNAQGDAVFSDPFTYAQPFTKGKAIVARNGNYGIIQKDSIITPLEYSNISRMKEFGDTMFKVYQFLKESVVYDAKLTQLPYVNFTPSKFNPNYLLMNSGRNKILINQQGKVLYEGTKYLKFTPYDEYYFRKRRRMYLYTSNGEELAIEMPEPESWLSESYYLTKKGSKMAVIHIDGDTLTPFNVREVQRNARYFLIETGMEQMLYSKDFELLESYPLHKKVKLDQAGDGFIVTKGERSVYYESHASKKKSKFKAGRIALSGGLIFLWEMDSVQIFKGDELIEVVEAFDYIEEEKDGVRLLMQRGMRECIAMISKENEIVIMEENYSCEYLGNGFLKMRVRKQDYKVNVYNPFEDLSFLCDDVEGNFCSLGFLLIVKDQAYFYIDTELKKQFYYLFEEAKPFVNGYAAVKLEGGWTLIDKSGELQSFPGYRELSNCGGKYFQTLERAKVGMVNAQGVEVIPPIYDLITKVSDEVVQVVKDGKVGYLHINGDVIYLPEK